MKSKIEFKYTDIEGSEYSLSFESRGGLVIGDILGQMRAFLISAGYTWMDDFDVELVRKVKDDDTLHE